MAKTNNLAVAFKSDPAAAPSAGESVEQIPLEQLYPDPNNPRNDLGDLESLAESIKAQGIHQPLIVRPAEVGQGYVIVIGHRRRAAAELAGIATASAVVRQMTPTQAQEAMLVENLHREGLKPLGEATAYQRLIELGYSQHDLAARVARSQAHISRRLALLKLPEPVRIELDAGHLRIEDALEFSKLAEMPKRQLAAVKNSWEWGHRERFHNVAHAVQMQVQEHEEAEKRGKARQQLKQEGVEILELKENAGYYGSSFYGRKERYLAGQGEYGYRIELSVEDHKGEACHRAVVAKDGGIHYVCCDPSRHAQKGSSKVKKPKQERDPHGYAKRAREEQKAREASDKLRREFLAGGQVLGVRRNTEQIEPWAAAALLARVSGEPLKVAAGLLGPNNQTGEHALAAIETALAEDPKQTPRVLFALALGELETTVANQWTSKKQIRGDYFRYLIGQGHQVSEVESKDLGKAFFAPPEPSPAAAAEDPDPDVPDHRVDLEAYTAAFQALPAGDERARWARVRARRTRETGSVEAVEAVAKEGAE